MGTVHFFYGLTFILMSIVLAVIPKNTDFFGVFNNFWALVIFGIIQGIKEWVNMFILNGWLLDVRLLVVMEVILLPASFIFIVLFAILNIIQRHPTYKWLRFIPVICLLPWWLAFVMNKGSLTAEIMARYFICFPGMILLVIDMISRLVLYKKQLPRSIFLCAMVFIFGSSVYAVVAGLIVPKAGFFPASLINYTNFIKIFGFHVQVVRMACAIVIALAIFGMTGIFYKDKMKVRLIGGIRRKVLFFTVLFSSILLVTSVLMMYFSGVFMLRKITLNSQQAIVQLMANTIGDVVESEVKELENYVASPSIWEAAINDVNSGYSAIPVKEMPEYFASKDKEWAQASADSLMVNRYISSMLSLRLKELTKRKGNIAEIFFTDRYGGLVVASEKTSDFYQADEEWWQKTFNAGRGSVFIGELEFDQSSGTWSITISVPVYNNKAEVIGVCKAVFNTLRFSDAVSKFEIGSTGQSILLDNSGQIICRSEHKPIKNKSLVLPEWKVIKGMQSRGNFQSSAYIRFDTGNIFLISWAVVPYKGLLQQGMKWFACVEQDTKEIFIGQEFMLILYSMVLFGILVILSLYFSYLFIRLLIRPIEKMRSGMREIASGNLNYYLNLRSGDELEDLSDSFNVMVDTLRKTLVSKNALITEVAERKQAEDMLELSKDQLEKQTQELNIQLEERKKTHEIMMSMLEDNNTTREALEKSLLELKQAQEIMVQVAKLGAVGQLASGVAHEVKNPLGIILQGINYLENKIPNAQKDVRDVLEMIKEGINRADRIVNGLLDFSKSSKLELSPEDINSVLESSINLAQVSTQFSGVEITKEMARRIPKVKIDKNKMEQVFINILVNAAQAMDNKGRITVRSYVKKIEKSRSSLINKEVDYFKVGEEALIVEVEDAGVGIPEENLKKIFEAFFSTKGPKGGAGLGLGICLNIVDMHKGLIDVESQVGKGTKVTVTLKLATEEK